MQIKPVLLAALLAVKGSYVRDTAGYRSRKWQIRHPLLGIVPRPPRARDRGGAHKACSGLNESPRGEARISFRLSLSSRNQITAAINGRRSERFRGRITRSSSHYGNSFQERATSAPQRKSRDCRSTASESPERPTVSRRARPRFPES